MNMIIHLIKQFDQRIAEKIFCQLLLPLLTSDILREGKILKRAIMKTIKKLLSEEKKLNCVSTLLKLTKLHQVVHRSNSSKYFR